MICVFVSEDKEIFSSIEQALIRNHMDVEWIDTAKDLLSLLSNPSSKAPDKKVALVIVDGNLPGEKTRDLIEQIITLNPMINCVATSALSTEAFHETFEGLGVLMQLPVKPQEADAAKLVIHLNKILGMTA